MRSRLPKVLHPVGGRPMIEYVLAALAAAGIERPIVVTGHAAAAVEDAVRSQAVTVRQEPQLGTADAVRVAMRAVPDGTAQVLVTYGDVPLQPAELFSQLLCEQTASGSAIVLLAAAPEDAAGYGRIVRSADGSVERIVEERDADDPTRAIREVNAGTYCFDAAWLRRNVEQVAPSASGEFYLTDLVEMALTSGRTVSTVTATHPSLAMGINDRVQLADAESVVRRQRAEAHMRAGVTIVDPASTFIGPDVEIAADTRIEPWTLLEGRTVIAEDCVIGPGTQLRDSTIGPRTRVVRSVVEESRVGEDAIIGPFSHLRPGSDIGARCRIGNYAEVKHSRIGADTQQHHFSYIGDADLGEGVNVGAGTVTANYDGVKKNRTVVGDGAFLGVDTMLRAPVTIGRGAKTGAGSVVTRDVADGKTVVGIPARPIELRRRGHPAEPAVGGADADRSAEDGA